MEFLAQYNLTGIVIGIATFLIIGIFHPVSYTHLTLPTT